MPREVACSLFHMTSGHLSLVRDGGVGVCFIFNPECLTVVSSVVFAVSVRDRERERQ